MWLSDLIRELSFKDMEIEFTRISSYEGTSSTGDVKMLLGLK